MGSAKSYQSDALQTLHETAEDLLAVSAIDKATMRHFDLTCLTPAPGIEPNEIRQIREQASMSQSVFARALNVSVSLVSKWERGDKKPSGPSLKLLALAKSNGIEYIL